MFNEQLRGKNAVGKGTGGEWSLVHFLQLLSPHFIKFKLIDSRPETKAQPGRGRQLQGLGQQGLGLQPVTLLHRQQPQLLVGLHRRRLIAERLRQRQVGAGPFGGG